MKAKLKPVEECASLFEIEVKKETIDKAFEDVYDEITKAANIPGFRAGKAPRELVKKHYARDARDEVLKRLIPEAYRRALEEHKVDAIGLPEISDVSFTEDRPLSFKARVDTRPRFRLKEYKGLKLERRKASVTDDEIEKTIQNLREMSAKYIAVEDRPVQLCDYVVSDMECFIDGKPAHKKRENLWLYADKEALLPELSQGLVGMKKGEEKDIELTVPEKYPDKTMAGKRARYHILAREIKLRKLPDLDDGFAKDLGKATLGELKKEIAKELEARAKANIEIGVENQLLKKLMDENLFGVPSSFVKRQVGYMVEDAKKRLEEKGFKKEELDKKDKELRDKFKPDAERQVRLLFILDEISRAEKIDVAGEEVEDAYKAIASQTGKTAAQVKEHYEKEDIADNLKDKIREAKTVRFLMEKAEIVEV